MEYEIKPNYGKCLKYSKGIGVYNINVIASITTQTVTNEIQRFGGGGRRLILLDRMRCNGFESRLIDCAHSGTGVHYCYNGDEVGVRCIGM